MPHTYVARWFVVSALVALFAGAAVLVAQPPLTRTPAAAPGYTNVVISGPVKSAQEGSWTVRAVQDGAWTVKVADVPLRTVVDETPPSFIRAPRSYVFSWAAESSGATYQVSEVRPDGWVRASTTLNGRRRDVWINSRLLATVEEIP